MSLEAQTCLRKDIGAAQMLRLRSLGLGVVIGGFVASESKITERQQVRGVGVAWLESVEATCEEECVVGEAVIEMVVYQLPQLGVYTTRRR